MTDECPDAPQDESPTLDDLDESPTTFDDLDASPATLDDATLADLS